MRFGNAWSMPHGVGWGGLELSKSCYAMMTWQLQYITEKICKIKEAEGSLTLRSDKYTGMEVELRRNKVNEAERLLEVTLDTEGDDATEYLLCLD